VEFSRPGGPVEALPENGVIMTNGVTGMYRILLTFMKKADFQIVGPSRTVYVVGDQEAAPLRQRWGKPVY
jgi:hypothetical protein